MVITITGQLLSDWRSADLKNDASCWDPAKMTISTSDSKTTYASPGKPYRVAQNSNVPFPFPIRVSFPYIFVSAYKTSNAVFQSGTCLYANGDVGKHPQENLGSLYGLNFALYDFLRTGELFCGEADAIALDANAPLSVGERGALDGTTGGDWNDALVSLDECYFAWRELVPKAHEGRSSALQHRRLRLQG